MALLLVTAGVAPASAASNASSAESSAFAGAHIKFQTSGNAVTDYTVNGDTVFQSVKVNSESNAGVSLSASMSAMTSMQGSSVSMSSKTKVSATIKAKSGAKLRAHDNEHGILVVDNNADQKQYVLANLSQQAKAKSTENGRVVVTTANNTKGTFIVIGDGKVTVNDEGDVVARLASDSRLAFRSYSQERSDDEKNNEQMIQNGTAAAEVYVMQRGGEFVTDTVSYGQSTTVKVTETTKGKAKMTAERSKKQGKVIITSVSKSVVDKASDVQVKVDGEAAARASSRSALKGAIGGDQSKYMAKQSTTAQGSVDVLIAVNHFSQRSITVSDKNQAAGDSGGETTAAGGEEGTSQKGPGFGIAVSVLALLGAALLARR